MFDSTSSLLMRCYYSQKWEIRHKSVVITHKYEMPTANRRE